MVHPISPLKILPCSISIETVYNILNSFTLINTSDTLSSKIGSWVISTRKNLSYNICRNNMIFLEILRDALAAMGSFEDFPSFLAYLSSKDPYELLQQMLLHLLQKDTDFVMDSHYAKSLGEILHDFNSYFRFMEQINQICSVDIDIHREVYALFKNPSKLKETLLSHLEYMWKVVIAAEWKRSEKILQQ
ncbi:hypothetical protein EPA93_14995 [Ktedonosporobacter rubrisoli]|uniref:Uncharacterized protein n=1 Tax=Ktedonosporobacter rubrisoli TaxID=2509675 RepID=A0A4V0YYS4_KTERU|nr:hypothetical protein [Ktedonosporobacter rubrisoli]QBD77231.1 hypothetical protein EPA93_14995 [Ktedonosporobacter rubrisoli]